MNKRILLTACLFPLLAGSASAAEAPCTLRVDGQVAIITCPLPGSPPPVVLPPVTPPPVLPPVVKPPPRDPTPFAFPPDASNNQPIDASDRTVWTWTFPGDFQDFYAYIDRTGNPLPQSHLFAGIIAPGAVTLPGAGWPTGRAVGDTRLWVPRSAGAAPPVGHPWDIRCVLATGRVCP